MNLADLADILITLINFAEKGLCKIRTRYNRTETQKRILSTCVRLFIEQGYSNTSPKQIFKEADVSAGTFYHLYKSKGGVLNELIDFMFDNQFDIADQVIGNSAKPVMLYAVETAIQLALAEINENIRDIYVQVYTQPDTVAMIQEKMTKELYKLFGSYIPEYSQSDFYEMEIGPKDFDICFTTTKFSKEVGTEIVGVNGLITGIGEDETIDLIVEKLKALSVE